MYASKMEQVTLNSNVNVVDLVYDIPTITVGGVVDDADREGLLETVSVKLKPNLNVPYPVPDINVPVDVNGSFSFKLPTRISIGGFNFSIVSVDISVWSLYYYPETTVGTGISTSQDIDLGTISISSYPLIQATFHVYTQRSSITLPEFHHRLKILYKDMEFPIEVWTNSSLYNVAGVITEGNGSIWLSVMGPAGTEGYVYLVLPKQFMARPYNVYLDGELVSYDTPYENATHVTISIYYGHSEHTITVSSTNVIPEFPLELITIFTMLVAVVVITIYLRKFL